MVNQAPDGVVLVDTETLKFTEFNDTACKDLGYSREEFARLTVLDINAEYSREWYISHIPDIVAQSHVVFETFHRHKDGRRATCGSACEWYRSGDGNISSVSGPTLPNISGFCKP